MNEKYVQALIVGSLIGGAILLNGHLNKPKLPTMPGKAMVIAQNKEMSWNDADGNVHVMVKKMPVDEANFPDDVLDSDFGNYNGSSIVNATTWSV